MQASSARYNYFLNFYLHCNTNHLQDIRQIIKYKETTLLKREERKPTRCNNIDDLLAIVDVDY